MSPSPERATPSPDGTPPAHTVLDHVYNAGFEVHRALLLLHRRDETGPAGHLRATLGHLDDAIDIVHRAGLADSAGRIVPDMFAVLAHALANGVDLASYLRVVADHATELPGVDACGVVLAETGMVVTVPGLADLCRLRPGPAWDTCSGGRPQTGTDLADGTRWPVFAARATDTGYRAVHTVPVRLRETTLGAIALFRTAPGALPAHTVRLGGHLADLAALGVLVHEAGQRPAGVVLTAGARVARNMADA